MTIFFYELTNSNLFEISKANVFNYEPGFVLLSYISVLLHIPPFLFFSLITVTLIIKSAYKYLGNFVYIFLLIYLYYGYFHNFSIVRQGVAAALFAYSIRYLIAKSYKYYILIFVAALFHMSAIMLLIVPFLYKIANRIPFSALLLFSLLMVYTSVSELIGIKSLLSGINALNIYINNSSLSYKVGFSFKYLELLIILVLFYNKRFSELIASKFSKKQYYVFRCLIVIEVMIYSLFNDFSIIYERLTVYFEFSHAICIAMIISAFKYKRVQLFLLLILLSLIFVRYYQLFNSPVRVDGEMTHYERFENYCSVFNTKDCQR